MSRASGHKPECPSTSPDPLAADCCCARLSAVERRVIDEKAPVFWQAGYSDGYSAGVQAAHDAGEDEELLVPEPECVTPDDPCAEPDRCTARWCARERLHLTLRDEADKRERGYLDGHKDGYAAGLAAAHDAVAGMVIETVGNSAATVDQALAAIDALRENKK